VIKPLCPGSECFSAWKGVKAHGNMSSSSPDFFFADIICLGTHLVDGAFAEPCLDVAKSFADTVDVFKLLDAGFLGVSDFV